MFKVDLEKAKNKRPTCQHPLDQRKSKRTPENIYFCFIDHAFACVDHNKLWKILSEMGIADHLTCLLINLYAGQEAEAEAPILLSPDVKSQLIRKDPDTGKY